MGPVREVIRVSTYNVGSTLSRYRPIVKERINMGFPLSRDKVPRRRRPWRQSARDASRSS